MIVASRIFIIAIACAALLTPVRNIRAVELPNVILLMGDDHGWDETGYNGHPHVKTPVLDEMVNSGLRLDHFYAAHPSCSPTRGSIITGRHPNRYGTFAPNYSIRPEEIGIAQLLKRAGYICGHFGKWHLGPVKKSSPTNPGAMGFDEWLSHDNFFELNPTFSRSGGVPAQFEGESSEILIDETIQFIQRTQERQKPFLAVVWFGSPHEPYSGLERDLKLYEHLPAKYADQTVKVTSNETGRQTHRPLGEVLQERYAEITAMDRAIGRLRKSLADQGLRETTLLWYCGDNGTPGDGIVTSPFRGQKGNMYEGGIRVPGLIEWPERITERRTSSVNCVTSDMLPTLCELAGQQLPDRRLDGISLVPLIDGTMTKRSSPIFFWSYDRGPESGRRRPYIDAELQSGTTPLVKMMAGRFTRNFTNFHHPMITADDYRGTRVMLDGRHKLIVSAKNTELFDLKSDPAENDNRAEADPDRMELMKRELKNWQTSVLQSLSGADY